MKATFAISAMLASAMAAKIQDNLNQNWVDFKARIDAEEGDGDGHLSKQELIDIFMDGDNHWDDEIGFQHGGEVNPMVIAYEIAMNMYDENSDWQITQTEFQQMVEDLNLTETNVAGAV
jgi:hypothetical protein